MLMTACGGLAGNIIMGLVLGHTHNHKHSGEGHSHDHTHEHSHDHSHSKPHNYEKNNDFHKTPQTLIKTKNLNMKAAIIHVLGDALQSVGVIIAGIVIYFNPSYSQADPVCTILFSIIVMFTTIPIVKDCIRVLMEGTPAEINPGEITIALKQVFCK